MSPLRPGELLGRILGASAGLIAVAALATAVYTAWITREQQKMSVWPYLMVASSDSGGHYNMVLRNAGLGPALIRQFELRVDGKPARNWSAVVRRVGWKGLPAGTMHSDLWPGRALLAGETVDLLTIPDTLDDRRFRTEVLPHLDPVLCYCSLYGDCWRLGGQGPEPQPATCPRSPRSQ